MEIKTLLLEHPRLASQAHFNDVANTPLSSCLTNGYIASLCKQRGFNVEIYDAHLANECFEQVSQKLAQISFDVLGVHAVYFWERTWELFSFLKEFKSKNQKLPVILYGFFPTFAYREILAGFPCLDAVILGEPEETFWEVLCNYKKFGFIPYAKIAGLAFRQGSQIKSTRRRAVTDPLDTLPFPERTDLFLQKIGGNMLGSRGCYAHCRFCYINNFYGNGAQWRGRSPQNIALEIETILPNLAQRYIYFTDANFFGRGLQGRKRAREIIARLKEWCGLGFGVECRCNDLDEELISRMASAGLRDVFLGIESASADALRRMGKGVGRQQSETAIKLLQSHGIEPNVGFIMFEPDSTLKDLNENFTFLQSNGLLEKLSNTADVLYHREIMLRGTRHFAILNQQGRLRIKDPLGYEGLYRFADPAVQFLADLMETVCRKVLKGRAAKESTIFWARSETRVSESINSFLVSFFEEALLKLKLGEISLTPEEMLNWEQRGVTAIEALLVEEQVCQA